MIETINKWLKLFGFKVWESHTERAITGEYIETRPDGDAMEQIRILRKQLNDAQTEHKASKRIAS